MIREDDGVIRIKAINTKTERFAEDTEVVLHLTESYIQRKISGDIQRHDYDLEAWETSLLYSDNIRLKKHIQGVDIDLDGDYFVVSLVVPLNDVNIVLTTLEEARELRRVLLKWIND